MNNIDDDNNDMNIQEYEDDNELEGFLNELPESDKILEYFQTLDHEILTEEYLTDEQIINMIQADKENQEVEESKNDKEISIVSVKNAVSRLKNFIKFFEQQNNVKFNNDDLHVFRKYLQIGKLIEFNSKKQWTLN